MTVRMPQLLSTSPGICVESSSMAETFHDTALADQRRVGIKDAVRKRGLCYWTEAHHRGRGRRSLGNRRVRQRRREVRPPALLWMAPVTLRMIFAVVYLSAKLGQVAGQRLFAVLRRIPRGRCFIQPSLAS